MPKSLANGDYSLLMAVESSSRANIWYRVLADRRTGALSCDCPPYIFNRNHDADGKRFCPHTRLAEQLIRPVPTELPWRTYTARTRPTLLRETQTQWPGLRGQWSIEEVQGSIGTKPYYFVLLRLETGNGGTATGVVAFAQAHHHDQQAMIPGVAGWAGYAIAAEVARLGGFPLAGQPPEHFRVDRRSATERHRARTQDTLAMPSIGLTDILRVGDIVRPGVDPRKTAEDTLRLFMGEETYALLERQGFLDISSVRHADAQRVYRLRRDPGKERDRRIRVFEYGRYVRDLCVVRAMICPEADMFLTNFLGLLSDEDAALTVVDPRRNVFPPYSDGAERETVRAIWRPRTATVSTLP